MIAGLSVLLAAGLGLLLVRTTPPIARWLAWLVLLAFAAALADPRAVAFAPTAARAGSAAVDQGVTEVLRAAAAAGPRAGDLLLSLPQPLTEGLGEGALGAAVSLPAAPLPVDPRRVQVRALREAQVGRPLALQIEAPGLAAETTGELVVQRAAREVARLPFTLDATGAAECDWLPEATGGHTFTVEWRLDGHRLVGSGALDVGPAPRVLVLEPSGVAAAALRAQGLAVEVADQLPADWRERSALVLGRALPAAQQQAIVAAAIDGLGVFALAPAFGSDGEPLRALLPLRPEPRRDEPGDGAGSGAEPAEPAPDAKPPEPPDDRPPAGATGGASPVANEPIDVDKRAIAMVLVVDRSWSMGNTLPNGASKMSYAKSSALRTAQALGAGDQVALVTFGNKGAGRVELPLTDAAALATVRAGIGRLAHGPEDTFLLSGMQLAEGLLAPSKAAVKHIVVVTDGEFRVEEALALQDLAMRMRAGGHVTLSMVSIIDATTEPSFTREAERLTRAGGGQFLPVEDPTYVPVLVSAEVTRALQRVGREPADVGGEPVPPLQPPPPEPPPPQSAAAPAPKPARLVVRAVAASPLLLPATGSWPTLGGAVPGTAPFDAQVLLVAGEAGWPLLAFGNRGLGRVGAFAADLGGADGAEFRAEASFPARFAQWVAAVLPAAPVRVSAPLLTDVRVTPPLPTQRDVAWLQALTGGEVGGAVPVPPPALVREVPSKLPRWALPLLLALVALALVERYAGLWSLRRTRSAT